MCDYRLWIWWFVPQIFCACLLSLLSPLRRLLTVVLGLPCSLKMFVQLRLKVFGRMVKTVGAGGVVSCSLRHVTVDYVTCVA